jgi:DNA polymerase type B, organellar and viral
MTGDDQTLCLNYLKGDVMGLKELTEKLNLSCFENFGVNLYKYISTSQLTYAVWVNFLFKESKNPILFQTPEHENFFQIQSMEEGHINTNTALSVNKENLSYIGGDLSFEDIKDYLIDADVNSLYPASSNEKRISNRNSNAFKAKYAKCHAL